MIIRKWVGPPHFSIASLGQQKTHGQLTAANEISSVYLYLFVCFLETIQISYLYPFALMYIYIYIYIINLYYIYIDLDDSATRNCAVLMARVGSCLTSFQKNSAHILVQKASSPPTANYPWFPVDIC